MLDGGSVVQADGDVYIARTEKHGLSARAVLVWAVANLLWMASVLGAFTLGQYTARADMRDVVAEEVVDQVRLILMP